MGKYQKRILSASELLELIQKQWADSKDIQLISGKGKNNSDKDKKEMEKSLLDQGYRLPKGLIPMEVVVDYYKINISYLKKITK